MQDKSNFLQGFSKKKPHEKLETVAGFFNNKEEVIKYFQSFHHQDAKIQTLLEEFSENTISNFPLPFCIAPNFLINGKVYAVPMVIEESSVVAAASKSAKFWYDRGGFHAEIIGTEKVGQVHFIWTDNLEVLQQKFPELKQRLIAETASITENMRKRGGGILDITLKDLSKDEPGLMQLFCTFETKDSMGANFINSCLEQFAETFKEWYQEQPEFSGEDLNIVMCILSNYTPNCIVNCWVETDIKNLDNFVPGMSGEEFAKRFYLGMRIPEVDPYRATTHNKGIYNGVDAVILASGNDFRAVEACGHTYAARDGQYRSLSHVDIKDGKFKFSLHLPLSLGVVGGLTTLHPLVKLALELLGHPSATELMCIAAAAGLANNFSAVKSLVTTGIQEGHMKMHLFNIMKQLEIPESYKADIVEYFKHNKVSVSEVRNIFNTLKEKK
ncbi:MAG TPA: hydroxymethylglutaryl-CoA reductase, degradative [Edaphocola sp.]|nr:hydroxymethylglutaryl-CoA reductase, degradative [Edaphocola sp.]